MARKVAHLHVHVLDILHYFVRNSEYFFNIQKRYGTQLSDNKYISVKNISNRTTVEDGEFLCTARVNFISYRLTILAL